jgi:serine O-acetyltransferase
VANGSGSALREKLGPFASDFEIYIERRGLTDAPVHKRVRAGLASTELRAVACFRFRQGSESLYRRSRVLGFLPFVFGRIWFRRQRSANHVFIAPSASVGPGLSIVHNYSILVGPATIGANCVLHHNVTIGDAIAGNSRALPTLGDGVWIGPGATIAGAVSIGDNVTISAGTVLTRSIPSGALVGGNPGRVVQLNYDQKAMSAAAETGTDDGSSSTAPS